MRCLRCSGDIPDETVICPMCNYILDTNAAISNQDIYLASDEGKAFINRDKYISIIMKIVLVLYLVGAVATEVLAYFMYGSMMEYCKWLYSGNGFILFLVLIACGIILYLCTIRNEREKIKNIIPVVVGFLVLYYIGSIIFSVIGGA